MTFECIFRVERLSKHNVGGQLDGCVILCGCDESVLALTLAQQQSGNFLKAFRRSKSPNLLFINRIKMGVLFSFWLLCVIRMVMSACNLSSFYHIRDAFDNSQWCHVQKRPFFLASVGVHLFWQPRTPCLVQADRISPRSSFHRLPPIIFFLFLILDFLVARSDLQWKKNKSLYPLPVMSSCVLHYKYAPLTVCWLECPF